MAKNSDSRRAKRLLEQAVPHIGRDVVIIAPGCTGDGYLATSMPTRTSHDLEKILTMLSEATKKVRRWQRRRAIDEKRASKDEVEL